MSMFNDILYLVRAGYYNRKGEFKTWPFEVAVRQPDITFMRDVIGWPVINITVYLEGDLN